MNPFIPKISNAIRLGTCYTPPWLWSFEFGVGSNSITLVDRYLYFLSSSLDGFFVFLSIMKEEIIYCSYLGLKGLSGDDS